MIPDFLEVDLNNFRRTNNAFQKFHKLIYFNLTILKYFVILLYSSSKLTEFKNNKIDKLLYNSFTTPTEGAWLNLLELLLSSKFIGIDNNDKIFNMNLPKKNALKFNQVYSLYIMNQIDYDQELSVKDFFKRIISIKNKLVSHGMISEEKAIKFLEALTPLLDDVLSYISPLLSSNLILLEENQLDADIYCEPIIGNKMDEYTYSEDFIENGLYFIFNQNYLCQPFFDL